MPGTTLNVLRDHLIHPLPAILWCQYSYHPAQAGRSGLRVDEWPALTTSPMSSEPGLQARTPSQAVCLQVCAPHLTLQPLAWGTKGWWTVGQGKEGHGAPSLRTWQAGTTRIPASSMPLQVGPYKFFPSHFLDLLLDHGYFRINVGCWLNV